MNIILKLVFVGLAFTAQDSYAAWPSEARLRANRNAAAGKVKKTIAPRGRYPQPSAGRPAPAATPKKLSDRVNPNATSANQAAKIKAPQQVPKQNFERIAQQEIGTVAFEAKNGAINFVEARVQGFKFEKNNSFEKNEKVLVPFDNNALVVGSFLSYDPENPKGAYKIRIGDVGVRVQSADQIGKFPSVARVPRPNPVVAKAPQPVAAPLAQQTKTKSAEGDQIKQRSVQPVAAARRFAQLPNPVEQLQKLKEKQSPDVSNQARVKLAAVSKKNENNDLVKSYLKEVYKISKKDGRYFMLDEKGQPIHVFDNLMRYMNEALKILSDKQGSFDVSAQILEITQQLQGAARHSLKRYQVERDEYKKEWANWVEGKFKIWQDALNRLVDLRLVDRKQLEEFTRFVAEDFTKFKEHLKKVARVGTVTPSALPFSQINSRKN